MNQLESLDPTVEPQEWKYLVLHHSATERGSVAAIDREHRQRKDQFGNPWLGIGYHFVIGNGRGMPDGHIEATFRWKEQIHGAHARSPRYNRWGIGICLIGDFETEPPTLRQMDSARQLCQWLMSRHDIETNGLLRHLDVAATRCPGRLFPYDTLMESIQAELVGSSSVSHGL
jgi:N-acetyl-anhydromuramyl-L-alanine amidase AmpD